MKRIPEQIHMTDNTLRNFMGKCLVSNNIINGNIKKRNRVSIRSLLKILNRGLIDNKIR